MKPLPRHQRRKLADAAAAVVQTLDRARTDHAMCARALDRATAVDQLLRLGPTADTRALARNPAAFDFYESEIAPNWDGLAPHARRHRVHAFAQLANTLPHDAPQELESVVRTKLLILAWTYDTAHGGDLLRRLRRCPHSFGDLAPRGPLASAKEKPWTGS